jgi:hypothetical protein
MEEKPKKERTKKYDDKLKVNGSFLDIMKASMKNADDNSKKKDKS